MRHAVSAWRELVLVACLLVVSRPAFAACTGDCNGDGEVTINSLMVGVKIALGTAALSACPAFDTNGDGDVTIDELLRGVNNALKGCAAEATATLTATSSVTSTPSLTDTATPTRTPTQTDTPTPTVTINQPPVLPTASIYRTYPRFDIRLPIGATDPEGGAVRCSAPDLPAGASFDESSGVLSWRPANDQLGPFYVPFSCVDAAPAAAAGQLTFKVVALDACAMPSCDPASGCTATLPPVSQRCCAAGAAARVAEPVAGCSAGRVLFVGQNVSIDSFGRLQNCDILRMRNFQQTGAEVQFHVETRCIDTHHFVRLHARLESNAAFHPLLFDVETRPFVLFEDADGFARQRGLRFSIGGGGPFFDLQGAEANLTVTLVDEDEVEVTDQLRVRLSFTPQPDRPDVDPTPPAD